MTIEEIAIKTMARDIGKHLQDITRLEATNAALVEALEAMVEEKCDYMRINNLGDCLEQHTVKQSLAALKLARGG